jgi:hypothetical protein
MSQDKDQWAAGSNTVGYHSVVFDLDGLASALSEKLDALGDPCIIRCGHVNALFVWMCYPRIIVLHLVFKCSFASGFGGFVHVCTFRATLSYQSSLDTATLGCLASYL